MGANERQVGGSHYKKTGAIEHWDIVVQHELDYFQGQITKYVMRWRDKGGISDLEKAKHFLEKYIEVENVKKVAARTEEIKAFWQRVPGGPPETIIGVHGGEVVGRKGFSRRKVSSARRPPKRP